MQILVRVCNFNFSDSCHKMAVRTALPIDIILSTVDWGLLYSVSRHPCHGPLSPTVMPLQL
jgi:hypothetical protein